jgi:hypothetical protein
VEDSQQRCIYIYEDIGDMETFMHLVLAILAKEARLDSLILSAVLISNATWLANADPC